MVPLAVVTEYDLGADGHGLATPSVLCPSVVTHTLVPGIRQCSGTVTFVEVLLLTLLEELVIFSEFA